MNKKSNYFIPVALIGIMMVFMACNSSTKNTSGKTEIVSVDSLVDIWDEAWNKKDTVRLASMFNDNSQMLGGSWAVLGKDSIMAKWINVNLPMVGNLKCEKINGGATRDMAFYTGFYSLDVIRNDSILRTEKGNVTFVWKAENDTIWKLALVHMGRLDD